MIAARSAGWPAGLVFTWLAVAFAGLALACESGRPASEVPATDILGFREGDDVVEDARLREVVELGVSGSVGALLERIRNGSPAVRARAAYSLPTAHGIAFGHATGGRATPREGSGSPNETGFPGGTGSPSETGPPSEAEIVSVLEAALGDPVPAVRADAAFALGRTAWSWLGSGQGEAADVDQQRPRTPPDRPARALSERLAIEDDRAVRESAIGALGALLMLDSPGALEALHSRLAADLPNGGGDPPPTSTAGEERFRVGGEAPESAESTLPVGEEHLWVRALARLGAGADPVPTPVRDLITSKLVSREAEVRRAAATFFSAPPSIRSWGGRSLFLRQALDQYERDDVAAMHLASAMAPLRDFMDASRMREWADSATDWRTRAAAVRGLNPETISLTNLVAALDDPFSTVAAAAALEISRVPLEGEAGEKVNEWLRGRRDRLGATRSLLINRARARENGPVLEWAEDALGASAAMRALAVEATAYVADPGAAGFLERLRSTLESPQPACQSGLNTATAASGFEPGSVPSPAADDGEPEHPEPDGAETLDRGNTSLPRVVPARVPARDGSLPLDGESTSLPRVMPARVPARDGALALDWEWLEELGLRPRIEILTSRGALTVTLRRDEAPRAVSAVTALASTGGLDCRWLDTEVMGEGVRIRPHNWRGDGAVDFRGTDLALTGSDAERTRAQPGRGALVVVGWGAAGFEEAPGSGEEPLSPRLMLLRSDLVHSKIPIAVLGEVTAGLDVLDRLDYLDAILSVRVISGRAES